MALKPNVGDEAERLADAVIMAWVGNRVSMRLQRDAIAQAIREATGPLLAAAKLALEELREHPITPRLATVDNAIVSLEIAIARAEGSA